MKKFLAVTMLALSLSACGTYVDPCTTLPAPNAQEIAASNSGAEIEREVEGRFGEVECELVNGAWVQEEPE